MPYAVTYVGVEQACYLPESERYEWGDGDMIEFLDENDEVKATANWNNVAQIVPLTEEEMEVILGDFRE